MAVINLKYYKEEYSYHDGSEQTVLEYINKYPNNYEKAFDENVDFPIYYHLSPIRENILNWYPFKPNSSILEIGAGMGAITKTLCEKGSKVTAVELSKERAEAIKLRCDKYDNLEIIVANFNDITFEEKFDYITLIGVLEYAQLYTDGQNPFEDFLKKIKRLLKPNGKLLIAIENRFGLKYWCGAIEDHFAKSFVGIRNYENTNSVKTFSKNKITTILNNSGFISTNFYYPLPDYKFPEIILSDTYALKNVYYNPYYLNSPCLLFDEKKIAIDIAEDKMLPFFANSFFIEASMNDNNSKAKVDFVKFTNYRLNKYKIMTVINEEKVYKKPLCNDAIDHINNINKINANLIKNKVNIISMKKNNNYIQMNFIENNLYNDVLLEQLREKNIEGFYVLLKKMCDVIKQSSVESKDYKNTIFDKYDVELPLNIKQKYFYLKDGYIDMNMFNCFLVEDKIKFFDQEWYEKNVPYEYIIQRGLRHFIHQNNLEKQLNYNEMLERLDIRDDYLDILEEKFQCSVNDKNAVLFLKKNSNYIDIGLDYENNIVCSKENGFKSIEYYKNFEEQYNEILKNRLYKILLKIRSIKNKVLRLGKR